MPEDFATRLFNLVKRHKELGRKLTKDQLAEHLGVSRTMLYNYEQEKPAPPAEILLRLVSLEGQVGIEQSSSKGTQLLEALHEDAGKYAAKVRMIPVVGWAHAGQAASYEELPESWVSMIPTECRDRKAFGVRLEGDSMESEGALSFCEGDLLVAMPSEAPYSGCFVVARFKDDGVVFRRFETAGKRINLVPLNKRYSVSEHDPDEFAWIYPVWGRWAQLWKW